MADPDQPTVAPVLANQCFTIFEGGGAKGITHLGALKAIEDAGLARIGTAGTSAGAIIAALTAVGYAADELFAADGANILAAHGKTPIDLLGRDDWGIFTSLRTPASETLAGRALRRAGRQLVTVLAALLPPLLPLIVFYAARRTGRPSLFASAWRILETFGFFSTESARDILNDLLRDKLGLPAGTLVCFRHMDPSSHPSCCALKIITTNLTLGGLELFDETTPDVVVADAVAASFSIPIFFKPTRIRRVEADGGLGELAASYADGGLISNLPVWVFLEDKKGIERAKENRQRRPIPVVAFQLVDAAAARRSDRGKPILALLAYIGNVVRTGISGGQSIAERFVAHLTIVGLPTSLGVVQFDCSRQEAIAAYRSGRTAAAAKLEAVFRTNPGQRLEILRKVVAQTQARSRTLRGEGEPVAFRASIVRRLGNRSFKVVASFNMDEDADDDLGLDQRHPGAPTAFHDRDLTYVDVRNPQTDLRMTKYERALVRPTLAGLISVPIFESMAPWRAKPADRPEPSGVLCLDSDAPLELEYKDAEFSRRLISIAGEAAPYLTFDEETS